MKVCRLFLYLGAGSLGWWGLVLWETFSVGNFRMAEPGSMASSHTPPADASSLFSVQRPSSGSAEITRIAAMISNISEDRLLAAKNHIELWPPGAVREFALAMLQAKETTEANSSSVASPSDSEGPKNIFRDFAAAMTAGNDLIISSDDEPYGDHTLIYWLSMDPSAATAAILMLPTGRDRHAAVDIAAGTIARYDPAAALDFVLKSGEQRLSKGAAQAWAKCIIKSPSAEQVRQYFDRMTLMQQNSLFSALATTVPDLNWNSTYTEYDDANSNVNDSLHRSDLGLIAWGVIQARESCPGAEAFIRNLINFPQVANEVRQDLESRASLSRLQITALDILEAERLIASVTSGVNQVSFNFHDSDRSDAIFDRAAPSLIPLLVRTGRVPEAVQLLATNDPVVLSNSFQAMFPYWLASDLVSARSAFALAPLTALERERWQRYLAVHFNQKK